MQRSEASGLSKLSVQYDPIFWPIFGYYQLLPCWIFVLNIPWKHSGQWQKMQKMVTCGLAVDSTSIFWLTCASELPACSRRRNRRGHESAICNQPTNPPTPKQENRKTGPLVYMSKLQLRDGRDRKCMDQTPESSAQLLSQSVSVAWFAYMFAYVWM